MKKITNLLNNYSGKRLGSLVILFFLLVAYMEASQLTDKPTATGAFNKLMFVENKGQWDPDIIYKANHSGSYIDFKKTGIKYTAVRREKNSIPESTNELIPEATSEFEAFAWEMKFENCNTSSKITSEKKWQTEFNYFVGNPSTHRSKVAAYAEISYKELYKGIDLHYYESESHIKYDFIVSPGANAAAIKMHYDGISDLAINNKNQLVITTLWGDVLEEAPYAYQVINNQQIPVNISYYLSDNKSFGFSITGKYDKKYPLIIDPIILKWATYVGGPASGNENYYLRAMDIDDAGNAYGMAEAYSSGFPVTNGSVNKGGGDLVTFKFDSNGQNLLYATYIGGVGIERPKYMDVDKFTGESYLTGYTFSGAALNDFPTTPGAYKTTPAMGTSDGFLVKLNGSGNILYSTYFGGSDFEEAYNVCIDYSTNDIVVAGITYSSDFPAVTLLGSGTVYTTTLSGTTDNFICRFHLNSMGASDLLYGTFIGGSGYDGNNPGGLAIDTNGDILLVGTAGTSDFPVGTSLGVGNVYDNILNGTSDGFLLKFRTGGNGLADLLYSTFVGGSLRDGLYLVELDGTTVVVGGDTQSLNYPVTPGAYKNSFGPGGNFENTICRFNLGGNGAADLLYGTYLEAKTPSGFGGLAVNSKGDIYAYVSDWGNPNLPVTSCAYDMSYNGGDDVGIYKIRPAGMGAADLLFFTHFGSAGADSPEPDCLRLLKNNNNCALNDEIYIALDVIDNNFPTTPGVYKPSKTGTGYQPVFAKFSSNGNGGVNIGFTADTVCIGSTTTFKDTTNKCGMWDDAFNTFVWNFGDGSASSSSQNPTHTYAAAGTYTVTFTAGNGICFYDTVSKPVIVNAFPIATITGNTNVCSGQSIQLTASGGADFLWSTGSTLSIISVSPTTVTNYSVIVSNGICKDVANKTIAINSLPVITAFSDQTICQGNTVNLSATGGVSYSWAPSAGLSAITGPTVSATPASTSTYTVTGTDSNGCTNTSAVIITVNSYAPANAGNDTTIEEGTAAILSASGGDTYIWSPSTGLSCITCKNPIATPAATTKYYLIVTDATGCTGIDSVIVSIEVPCIEPFIPNAFSPNDDGQNDLECVFGTCIQSMIFTIYNRWGEKIFETEDPKACWNGEHSSGLLNNGSEKEVNETVFAYYLNATLKNKKTVTQRGNITLVK